MFGGLWPSSCLFFFFRCQVVSSPLGLVSAGNDLQASVGVGMVLLKLVMSRFLDVRVQGFTQL